MRCVPLADDCGISTTNVDAIIRCVDAGSLRGTALLACGNALQYAVDRLTERMRGKTPVMAGVHLNLFEGFCCAPQEQIPLLADDSGRFLHSLGSFYRTLYLAPKSKKNALMDQATIEWLAQIKRIRDLFSMVFGKEDTPLYLDGHQHVHAIPALRPALSAVLEQERFTHVRVPQEITYMYPSSVSLRIKGTARRELLALWGKQLRQFLDKRAVKAPHFFLGAFASGNMTIECVEAGLAAVAKQAGKNDMVEIMAHPGAHNPQNGTDLFGQFYSAPEREKETAMLLSPRFRQALMRHDPEWRSGALA